ncbi:MAG TPA: hypothetical protein VIJ95_11220 [Hanamia sp.]
MEVHHHPDLQHKKKNFKEYFLEFLMIFLAVTMGFIAENIRESISEHQRAKSFASSMIQDLKTDTSQLNSFIRYYSYAENNIDTFMNLLSRNDPSNIPSGKLYWYGLFGGASGNFISNDATFEQMKSSGSISFFKPKLATEVAKYDQLCRQMQVSDETGRDIYSEVRKIRAMIFEFKYNDIANQIFQKNEIPFRQARIDSFIATNPPLLSYDKILFNEYAELVRSRFIEGDVALAKKLHTQADVLLAELIKEYY